MKRAIRKTTAFASIVVSAVLGLLALGYYILPDRVTVSNDTPAFFNIYHPDKPQAQEASALTGLQQVREDREYSLFGVMPVKTVSVVHSDRKTLYVGGDVIGLQMLTDGVVIVDMQEIETENGTVMPAKAAGLQNGDIIIAADGTEVCDNCSFSAMVENSKGKQLQLSIKRGEEEKTISILPQKCKHSGKYKCGLLVRDTTLGIGTMTYYDPQTGVYGALGHSVSDSATGELLPIAGGQIVDAYVWNIKKGERGTAGELGGALQETVMGSIEKNCDTGIYGLLYEEPLHAGEYPIAWATEIKTGPAEVLLSLDGETIERYEAKIDRINIDYDARIKNMVVEITDEELLEKTGGIVQGMSGSPIIQDGKLIGAVTHVLLNDPTRGYGIFIENMLTAAS